MTNPLSEKKEFFLNLINKFQKELLEIVDDCVNDWSYIEREYNKKFEELKQEYIDAEK